MDRSALDQDEIRLTVPADPAFARVTRVAGGALAARLGFTYEEVEEIRLAVGEAWTLMVGPEAADGEVQVVFRVGDRALSVELTASVSGPLPDAGTLLDGHPGVVLSHLTDALDVDEERRWIRFTRGQAQPGTE